MPQSMGIMHAITTPWAAHSWYISLHTQHFCVHSGINQTSVILSFKAFCYESWPHCSFCSASSMGSNHRDEAFSWHAFLWDKVKTVDWLVSKGYIMNISRLIDRGGNNYLYHLSSQSYGISLPFPGPQSSFHGSSWQPLPYSGFFSRIGSGYSISCLVCSCSSNPGRNY